MHRIALNADPHLIHSHIKHGQYIELRPTSSLLTLQVFFALAQTPGESPWYILAKEGGEMGDYIRSLVPGSELVTSLAQGAGFPLQQAKHNPLLLIATGSAIAAVLSSTYARIKQGLASQTYLVFGTRTYR